MMSMHHGCGSSSGERWFSPRGRGHRGFGRAFGKFGSGMMGGRGGGFPFGRFVGDGELRLVVLALLADEPRHGYDIIKAMEERSSGFYSPSPGVIYPTLTYLEETEQATAAADGNKKVYSITESGRAYLSEKRETADAILARIDWVGKRLAQARQWFDKGGAAEEPGRDMSGVLPELDAARRKVREALLSKLASSPEEQRRVADVLRRAADEILGPRSGSSESDDHPI